MATKRRIGPAEVIDMILSGLNEMEANGYEVAQATSTIGEAPSWYGPDGETPTVDWAEGGTMMFIMPDGSKVRVEAHRDRRPT